MELEKRVSRPSDLASVLDDVAAMLRKVEEPYARVTVHGVSAEQHRANRALADAVEDADGCLVCGKDTGGAAFCGFGCLQDWEGET